MALSRTAKFYRDNPKARIKHRKTSTAHQKTSKGRAYKKAYNKRTSSLTASRVAARRKVEKRLGRKLGSGKHVDHIDKNAANNSSKNLRVTSKKFNLRRNKK